MAKKQKIQIDHTIDVINKATSPHRVTQKKEINYGLQYIFENGTILNVYTTGKVVMQGKKNTELFINFNSLILDIRSNDTLQKHKNTTAKEVVQKTSFTSESDDDNDDILHIMNGNITRPLGGITPYSGETPPWI